ALRVGPEVPEGLHHLARGRWISPLRSQRIPRSDDGVPFARDQLEVAGEVLFRAAEPAAAVDPDDGRKRSARPRGPIDVENHVGLVAVALVVEPDDAGGRVRLELAGHPGP